MDASNNMQYNGLKMDACNMQLGGGIKECLAFQINSA